MVDLDRIYKTYLAQMNHTDTQRGKTDFSIEP